MEAALAMEATCIECLPRNQVRIVLSHYLHFPLSTFRHSLRIFRGWVNNKSLVKCRVIHVTIKAGPGNIN